MTKTLKKFVFTRKHTGPGSNLSIILYGFENENVSTNGYTITFLLLTLWCKKGWLFHIQNYPGQTKIALTEYYLFYVFDMLCAETNLFPDPEKIRNKITKFLVYFYSLFFIFIFNGTYQNRVSSRNFIYYVLGFCMCAFPSSFFPPHTHTRLFKLMTKWSHNVKG